jgi:hypothetical protein
MNWQKSISKIIGWRVILVILLIAIFLLFIFKHHENSSLRIADFNNLNLILNIGIMLLMISLVILFWHLKRAFQIKMDKISDELSSQYKQLNSKLENIEQGYKETLFNYPQTNPEESYTLDTIPSSIPLDEGMDEVQLKLSKEDYILRFIEDYNNAAQNEEFRISFMKTYQPVRLAITNVMERKRGNASELTFEKQDDGDFLAIDFGRFSPQGYLVVPRFTLIINDTLYETGAMGKVYKCEGYAANMRYKLIVLLKPARFQRDETGWALNVRGYIRLKDGKLNS